MKVYMHSSLSLLTDDAKKFWPKCFEIVISNKYFHCPWASKDASEWDTNLIRLKYIQTHIDIKIQVFKEHLITLEKFMDFLIKWKIKLAMKLIDKGNSTFGYKIHIFYYVCISCSVVSNSLQSHGLSPTRLLCSGILLAQVLE